MTGPVKRRIIWLTDEEWARLNARAAQEGRNASNLVRALVGEAPVTVDRYGTTRIVSNGLPEVSEKGETP